MAANIADGRLLTPGEEPGRVEAIQEFVLQLIEKDFSLPGGIDIESFSYIDKGYVDSIGVIKFVLDIESQFGIEISESDMESTGFRTVGGIVSIINRQLACATNEGQ